MKNIACLLLLTASVVSGCTVDEDEPPVGSYGEINPKPINTAGTAGTAGEGGSSGSGTGATGGSTAGTAGSSGSAGTAGMGGGTGGSSGSSGSAGSSGSGNAGGGSGAGGAIPGTPVSFETYNVAMAGAFIPYEAERRAALGAIINAMTSDIVCIQEAWAETDKQLIKDAVAGHYDHVASFVHDNSTPVVDNLDIQGNPVTPPSTPPCANNAAQLDTALNCLKEKCSTIPNSDDGKTTSTDCAASKCAGAAGALIFAQDKRCYGCLAPQLPTETFGDIRTMCTTENNPLAFGGQSGTMLLSKYPFVGTPEDHIIPATWNRRNIIAATVQIDADTTLDVYCNHFSAIFVGTNYPYTGQFGANEDGSPATGGDAWANEQYLQATKLLALVDQRSGTNPAIILGDFNSSKQTSLVMDEGVKTINYFKTNWNEALVPDYDGGCTYCAPSTTVGDLVNPLVPEGTNTVWLDHIFVKGIPPGNTKSLERTITTFDVDVGGGTTSPHSDHFGIKALIEIPLGL